MLGDDGKEEEERKRYDLSSLRQDARVYAEVVGRAWVYLLATVVNFGTTLVVFPAVCTLVEPANPVRDIIVYYINNVICGA